MFIPMDDFQVILGIEFLQDNKAVPMPYMESLFMFKETSCMIPTISKRDGKKLILVLQLKKGLRKEEMTYMGALKVETKELAHDLVPDDMCKVLDEFKDMMSKELLKNLPP